MALSRIWYSLADVPFPLADTTANILRGYLFLLKNLLLGQAVGGVAGATGAQPASKWALVGSSNGVAFGLDATERLGGSVYDASKWGWALSNSTTTPHSWFVLYNATLGLYVVVDLKSSSASEGLITFGACTAMPTGGSLTAAPALAGVLVQPYAALPYFEGAATNTHRCNFVVDAANGYFFLTGLKSGATPAVRAAFALWPTTGPAQRPTWLLMPPRFSVSGQGVLGYIANTLGGTDTFRAKSVDGAVGIGGTPLTYASAGTTLLTNIAGPNAQTGQYDTLPVLVHLITTGHASVLGLEDVDVVGDGLTGTTTPTSGATERAVFGNLLFPFASPYTL